MPDLRRQDAALAAATTVWSGAVPLVLPLAVALPAIQGARIAAEARRHSRLSWLDEPAPEPPSPAGIDFDWDAAWNGVPAGRPPAL